MSAFLTTLDVELMTDEAGKNLLSRNDRQLWRVIDHPFCYQSDVAGVTITTPVGFVTDFASIPQIFLSLFGDVAHRPSLPHDFEYSGKGALSREMADQVLKEACLLTGLSKWKAFLIYAGVRVGGAANFRVE